MFIWKNLALSWRDDDTDIHHQSLVYLVLGFVSDTTGTFEMHVTRFRDVTEKS